MTEIQQDSNNPTEAPFQDEMILEAFYDGAGRGDLLVRLKAALASGVPLMVLSGGEGSGKTMLCRMLEQECPASIIAVFFPSTVESFEDVVRNVAQKLGLQLSSTGDGKTIDAAIEQIISHLLRHSKGLLVIFDEAEDIYLATLERIRKMLDRLTAAGASLQILFSGRKTFLENCEQLSRCDFRTTEDLHFDVLPLNEQETADYLRSCAERLVNPEKREVFNDEVVRNIHSLAKGKFKNIKLLAVESLRSQTDDTSFMVLLESVKDEAQIEDDKNGLALSGMRRATPYLWWIGGSLCALILLFFFLQTDAERRVAKPISYPPTTDTMKVENPAQEETVPQLPDKQLAVGEKNLPPEQHQLVSEKQHEMGGQKASKELEANLPVIAEAPSAVEKTQEIAISSPVIIKPATKKEKEPVPAHVRDKIVLGSEPKVPDLRQKPSLKIKPGVQQESAAVVVKPQPRAEVQENVGANAHLTVDQLYQKRLNAGSAWGSGEKNNLFTIQLMVLAAKNAELNLKKMLAQPNYRQEAGNFFLFKKNGSTEVVLVFYGEYPTIELAHLAQNSLPQFLRDHQPYAISIKGAIAKVGK